MPTYVLKPSPVEAVHYDPATPADLEALLIQAGVAFVPPDGSNMNPYSRTHYSVAKGDGHWYLVAPGDWVLTHDGIAEVWSHGAFSAAYMEFEG